MARIPQVTPEDEREATITIDYGAGLVICYSNHATIINRLESEGYKHYSEQLDMKTGDVLARQYKFPIDEMGKFLKVKHFRTY